MHGTDAGAGQHGVKRFGDHRHVERHAVALGNTDLLQLVGHAADMIVQLAIGDRGMKTGIIAFPDQRDIITALGEMAVDAIVGDVENAVSEPFDRQFVGIPVDVRNLRRGLDPVEAAQFLGPEGFGFLNGTTITLLVLPQTGPRIGRIMIRNGDQFRCGREMAVIRHVILPERPPCGPGRSEGQDPPRIKPGLPVRPIRLQRPRDRHGRGRMESGFPRPCRGSPVAGLVSTRPP